MNIDNYNVYKGKGMTGKKHSQESIEKMRKSSLGQTAWNKGKKMSDSMREKMRINKLGNKNRLGKTLTQESREKIAKGRQGKCTGVEHPAWKGGVSTKNKRANDKRKYRTKIAGGFHTNHEWEMLKIQYNNTCPACKKNTELTKDHIIPVSKGGSNNIENIQPLCKRCNSKKHTLIIKY